MLTPNWFDNSSNSNINAFTICRNDNLNQIISLLPPSIMWLNQEHGINYFDSNNIDIISRSDNDLFCKTNLLRHFENNIDDLYKTKLPCADASFTSSRQIACAIKTADCVPILLKNQNNTWVSAIHAGWRGLLSGVIENSVANYNSNNSNLTKNLMAWLGPFICPLHFIVGDDVRDKFIANDKTTKYAFTKSKLNNKWHADLYKLTIVRLNNIGINNIQHSGICTYCSSDTLFSYRRDKDKSGRIISFIWID